MIIIACLSLMPHIIVLLCMNTIRKTFSLWIFCVVVLINILFVFSNTSFGIVSPLVIVLAYLSVGIVPCQWKLSRVKSVPQVPMVIRHGSRNYNPLWIAFACRQTFPPHSDGRGCGLIIAEGETDIPPNTWRALCNYSGDYIFLTKPT